MARGAGRQRRPAVAPASGGRRRWPLLLGLGVAAAAAAAWLLRPGARPDLLLITIDTLRADRLGVYGAEGAATPSLDALAGRGTLFARARAAAPLTGPSHATILTGLYPPQHGVRDNVTFPLDDRHPTLATILRRHGYRTAAFVGAYPVAGAFGFRQGFDAFEEGFHPSEGFGQAAERPANEVADAALRWLARQGAEGSLFLWVHFYDPHAPYSPPAPFDASFRERPYDGEIAFTDSQIGRLVEALRSSGRLSRTLVVAVADHGEAFGEHDEATHGVLMYDAALRVPWILAGPGVPEGVVVPDPVGTVDLVPTVLGLLGLRPPAGLPGRDLRPALTGEPLAPEPQYAEALFGRLNCRWSALRGVIEGDWKLIAGAETELFRVSDDPGEVRNRAAEEPERVRRLQGVLGAMLGRLAPNGDTARPGAVPPEQEERLRSLGYAAGSGGAGVLDEPGLPDPRTRVRTFEALQAALLARGAGALASAAERAERLTQEDPGNPFAHFTLASLAYRSGRLAAADRAFSRTLELDPDRPGMRFYHGRLLREMGRLEESERQLRIAVAQTTTGDVRTRVGLAETLVALGKLDEAEALLGEVLRQEPEHAEAHGTRGRLLLARGRTAEALPHLRRAVQGRDPEPWIALARGHLAAGDVRGANDAVREALARSPGHPGALGVAAQALLLEGRRQEAVALLKKAVALRPRRPEVWRALAQAFEDAGDAATASFCRRQAAAWATPS